MGALIGLVRVPPGCSRSASSMRKASKAQAEKVAVVATCTARLCSACTEGAPSESFVHWLVADPCLLSVCIRRTEEQGWSQS